MSAGTRIKFCGLTRESDVDAAVALGVDLIGFVFAPGSARRITPGIAGQLRQQMPAGITTVALLMDNSADAIGAIIDHVRPDLLQFHGQESVAFCTNFGIPFIKAMAMAGRSAADVVEMMAHWSAAQLMLFDGHGTGEMGGSGHAFDWTLLPDPCDTPFLLAGGLNADNVATAISTARPWGVDVSSGIETEPGIKDVSRMREFVLAVRAADRLAPMASKFPQN